MGSRLSVSKKMDVENFVCQWIAFGPLTGQCEHMSDSLSPQCWGASDLLL